MDKTYSRKTYYKSVMQLNPDNSPSTGSIVCYDGDIEYSDDGVQPCVFVEIADCRQKVRLHRTHTDATKDFLSKIDLMINELKKFRNHLELYHLIKRSQSDNQPRIIPTDVEYHNTQSKWISVKERLPKPLEEVLLYNASSIQHYVVGWLRKKKDDNESIWALTNGYVSDEDITHWMPIPTFDENIESNKDVLKLFNKPLAQRLTELEKEMIIKEYENTYPNDPDNSISSTAIASVLERIFGKDFFENNNHEEDNV